MVAKNEEVVMFVKIPRHLRDAYKAYCASRGKGMSERLIEILERETKHDANRNSAKA